jgi:DnaK suppressor protein
MITFPKKLLEPIRDFLSREEKRLEKRKKVLEKEDPFEDVRRLTDNAASDADAAEQAGHERITALKTELDRKLIQVRKALTMIKIGKYGTCEKCGQMIDTDRLMIYPEATVCVKCKKKEA